LIHAFIHLFHYDPIWVADNLNGFVKKMFRLCDRRSRMQSWLIMASVLLGITTYSTAARTFKEGKIILVE